MSALLTKNINCLHFYSRNVTFKLNTYFIIFIRIFNIYQQQKAKGVNPFASKNKTDFIN